MKAIKIFIIVIILFIGAQNNATAKDIKEITDTWLQKSNKAPMEGGGLIGDEDPDGDLNKKDGAAIHDGIYILLALAGAYMIVCKNRGLIIKSKQIFTTFAP